METLIEPSQAKVVTLPKCRWVSPDDDMTCMQDGLACDGECEGYEPTREVVDFGTLRA